MLILALTFFSNKRIGSNPFNPATTGFMIFWFVGVTGIIIYHVINATRRGGAPTTIIESEEDEPPASTANRLQELENLHHQKLISDAEYEMKRQEILKSI